MNARAFYSALALAVQAYAIPIPAGTELSVRLTDKVASEAATQPPAVHAVLIAPVIVEGKIALAAGAQLTGTVKQAKAAADKEPAQLQLVFNEIADGAARAQISAIVTSLDNARETVDDKGVIAGIAARRYIQRPSRSGDRETPEQRSARPL